MRVDRKNLLYPILYLVILAGANALHLVPPHILSYQMIHLLQYMIYVLLILGWATTVSASKSFFRGLARKTPQSPPYCSILTIGPASSRLGSSPNAA